MLNILGASLFYFVLHNTQFQRYILLQSSRPQCMQSIAQSYNKLLVDMSLPTNSQSS